MQSIVILTVECKYNPRKAGGGSFQVEQMQRFRIEKRGLPIGATADLHAFFRAIWALFSTLPTTSHLLSTNSLQRPSYLRTSSWLSWTLFHLSLLSTPFNSCRPTSVPPAHLFSQPRRNDTVANFLVQATIESLFHSVMISTFGCLCSHSRAMYYHSNLLACWLFVGPTFKHATQGGPSWSDLAWVRHKSCPSWAQVGSGSAQLKAKDGQVWPEPAFGWAKKAHFFPLYPIPYVRAVLVAKRLQYEL